MRILVVSSYLPYPLFSGGHVRLFNILKELSKKHEVTLVCEKRKHQTQHDIDKVQKLCKDVFTVQRKKQWSPNVVISTAISPLPFLLAGHDLPEMKKIIHELLQKETFDVIHVETFYVLQNIPQTAIPIVLTEHNIEYGVYQRFVDQVPFLLRPLLQIDVEKIKNWERKAWNDVAKVVGVSEIEAKQMRSDAAVVANGVNLSDFPYKKKSEKTERPTILFMGDFKWIQNRDSCTWILKDIWPQIIKELPNATLWIVGKHIPENFKNAASDNIVVDEHAPDKTSDIYKKADLLLSPIRVGGGTSYKILEAMASGVPVVTTGLGIEGLRAQAKKDALVAENSQVLAKETVRILKHVKEYEALAKSARKFIEEKYTWSTIVKKLEEVYEDAVKKN